MGQGELCIVRCVIERKAGKTPKLIEANIIDNVHAVKTKKQICHHFGK